MIASDKSPSRKRSSPGRFRKLGSIFSVVDARDVMDPVTLRAVAKLARTFFPERLFGSARNVVGRDVCALLLDTADDLAEAEIRLGHAEEALRHAGWWRQDATGDWRPPPRLPGFAEGDAVSKVGGDYTFDGEVRGVLLKRSGLVRYVVEDDRGVLHIFSGKQLAHRDLARSA